MGNETARSKVGRKVCDKRKMIALRQEVGFKSGAKARRQLAKEHRNRVAVRKRSPTKRQKTKIMLPREAILVKGHIMMLTRDIWAISKVREGRVATGHSEQQNNNGAIVGRR